MRPHAPHETRETSALPYRAPRPAHATESLLAECFDVEETTAVDLPFPMEIVRPEAAVSDVASRKE